MTLELRKTAVLAMVATLAAGCATTSPTPDAGDPSTPSVSSDASRSTGGRSVQPGAPGEATREVDAAELSIRNQPQHVAADTRFMQGMIPHHAQALEMTALVLEHGEDAGLKQMALRMEISQRDEIGLMERWLKARGESLPEDHSAIGMGAAEGMQMSGMGLMPGMLTPAEMEQLRSSRGEALDRLFLELMIKHHEGAITMVAQLFGSVGGGQESEIYQFASHVDADQRMEIDRMRMMLEGGR